MRLVRSIAAGICASALAACATVSDPRHIPYTAGARPTDAPPLTPLQAGPVARDNKTNVKDFAALVFEEESGRRHARLNKLAEPIAIVFDTALLSQYGPFADDLATELRSSAEIDISLASNAEEAQAAASRVHIRFVSWGEMEQAVPDAQCIFLPGAEPFWRIVDDRKIFRRLSRQIAAEDTTVYIPVSTTPDEVRECFYEEVLQALGPRNDLLHLPDSIFNDENAHLRPTPYDLLILKALYHPRLAPLEQRSVVMEKLPGILAEIHPSGVDPIAERPPLQRWPQLDDLWKSTLSRKNDETAREKKFARVRELARDLPDHDYRRLAFEAVEITLSDSDDRPERFEALAEAYEKAPLNDPLRAALMRAEQAHALDEAQRWSEIHAVAMQAVDALARAGRDYRTAELHCAMARADIALKRRAAALQNGARCVEWMVYALGSDHEYASELRAWMTRHQSTL